MTEQPSPPLHVPVTLRTGDGSFVGRTLVPDFTPPAEVLFWGVRVFKLAGPRAYVECMAYYVIHPVQRDEAASPSLRPVEPDPEAPGE
jgi:hypothetical protein